MKKFNVFHIIFIALILFLGLAVFLRIKGWVRVVDPAAIPGTEEGVADYECHDHIMPLTDEEYNLIRQNEETILILGNDPFAADRGDEKGLGTMLGKLSGASVINCAVSGSYIGMIEPCFDFSVNPMNIFSPYYLACVACGGKDYTTDLETAETALGNSFPEEGREILSLLGELDISSVDVIVIFYDGEDYLKGTPTGLDEARYSDPYSTYLGAFSSTVEMLRMYAPKARFIIMSAPYMYISGKDGKPEACEDHPNSEGADLSDYVLGLYRMCVNDFDITFLDNYYTGINFPDGTGYLSDGRHLNEEGRQLVSERLMYALTYYDESNIGNVAGTV